MGFFDEDNLKFEVTLSIVLVVFVFYIGSFVYLRSVNTHPCEEDGCWYKVVSFPGGAARVLYLPMIGWDKKLRSVRYTGDE